MKPIQIILALVALAAALHAAPPPAVFPEPRELQLSGDALALDDTARILVPLQASPQDAALARMLTADLSDHYGLAIATSKVAALPRSGRFILMGSASNPLVKQYCAQQAVRPVSNPEGYALKIDGRAAVVAGADDAGAFYGMQSLRQLIEKKDRQLAIRGASARDWPFKPFRGIKMYLPGHQNIAYFKRFVRDFMALYKFNKLLLELNAAMRLDRHPELNAGWLELGKDLNYTRRTRSYGPGRQYQDSANADTADSEVLEKSEVADLVRYAAEYHIEVIPEIPSLTHSYYLLTRHRELAEIADAEWPDTYCPSNPQVYPLVFDVLDEYISVMKPRMVHIGHDEWRMPLGVCPRCRGKDPTVLYAQDLNKIYAHLRKRNVEVAIWGDHLMERVRGKRTEHVPNPKGTPYDMPGGLSEQQVKDLIPKDILIFNWFWTDGMKGQGEKNDATLSGWGFRQVYGNMRPDIKNYDRRSALKGVLGGAPSSWAATNELNFGKDLMYEFLGCANLLWSTARPDEATLSEAAQRLLPRIRRNLSALPFPSDNDPMTPLQVHGGDAIPVGQDVSSLLFLHAAAKPGRNVAAYYGTWNFADTAELLGWYEVVYEDGLIESVPVRYGVNILESGWLQEHKPHILAYEAELVEKGGQALFSYEWINPRFGKVVKEVRLHGDGVRLAGVSMVKKRVAPEPKALIVGR